MRVTPLMRRTVKTLRADRWADVRIARFMGISEPTLRKYFAEELQYGDDMLRGEILLAITKKALEGSVPAARHFERMTEGEPFLPTDHLAQKPAPEPKEEHIGKKEMAEIEAQQATVDSPWAKVLRPH